MEVPVKGILPLWFYCMSVINRSKYTGARTVEEMEFPGWSLELVLQHKLRLIELTLKTTKMQPSLWWNVVVI